MYERLLFLSIALFINGSRCLDRRGLILLLLLLLMFMLMLELMPLLLRINYQLQQPEKEELRREAPHSQ